jgi:hypothetical protein
MSAGLVLRGGSELSPAEFGGSQSGGLTIMSGSRKHKRSRHSKRSGSSRHRRGRKLRGGNCGGMAPMGMSGGNYGIPGINPSVMSGGNLITPPQNAGGRKSRKSRSTLRRPLVMPRYGGGRTRRLRKHSGKARRHRTKSYSA